MTKQEIDKLKIVIYKVLTSDYDTVSPPPKKYINNSNIEFLLFTSGNSVEGWKTIKIPNGGVRQSRYLKINSHLLQEYTNLYYDYSLYFDSCLELNENFIHNLFLNHSVSNKYPSIQEHQDFLLKHCEKMKSLKKELSIPIDKQLNKYNSVNFNIKNVKTWECCAICRPNNDITEAINEAWWKEYCLDDSSRDQITLPYVMHSNKDFNIHNLKLDVRKPNDIFSNWCRHSSKMPPTRTQIRRNLQNSTSLIQQSIRSNILSEITDTSKLKVAVCTIYIGEKNEFYDICTNSIKEFAKRYGYDYHEINDSTIFPHPSWERLRFKELLDGEYDVILYIDGDIFVKEYALDPIKYYPLDGITTLNSYSVYNYMRMQPNSRKKSYNKEWENAFKEKCPLNFPDKRMINAGVMIIPKCCKEFLSTPDKILSDGSFFEQTLLNCRSLDYKYYELDRSWNVGHVNRRDNMIFAKSDNSNFVHFNTPHNIPKIKFLKIFQDKTENTKRMNNIYRHL